MSIGVVLVARFVLLPVTTSLNHSFDLVDFFIKVKAIKKKNLSFIINLLDFYFSVGVLVAV
jgi:hypothetical protein